LGEQELALRWSEEALLRGLPKNYEVEAKKAKAARLKRQRRYAEAVDLWQGLSDSSESFLEDVHEELAIYYEHRKRNLAEALRLSEFALAQLQGQASAENEKWENRRARVARKLARCRPAEPARLFDRQN
jgi:tetratricopeptide (TPR) repeat protein